MKKVILFTLLCSLTYTALAAIIMGNPKGEATLIEIIDPQCEHCQNMYPVVAQLIADNRELKVRLMPVAILKKHLNISLYEASALVAAVPYGKFDTLYQSFMLSLPSTMDEVTQLLHQLDLTSRDFVTTMHAQTTEKQILQGLTFLKHEQSGIPLFIVYASNHSTQVFKGEQSYEVLQQAINKVG